MEKIIKNKIFKNYLSTCKSYLLSPSRFLFLIHNILIVLFYGNLKKYYIFQLPPKFNDELLSKIFLGSSSVINLSNCVIPHKSDYLFSSFYDDSATELRIDANIKTYDIDCLDLIRYLHKSIKDLIAPLTKSPFIIINTRAWTSKPNSERFGPNALHLDGFFPGHLKIMIYCSGLSIASGSLQIEDQVLNDHPPGTCVLFKNSNALHSGIPGSSMDRHVLEITIARSFSFREREIFCHPLARHLKSVLLFYK
ncbi:hypothetical protein [Polynucleobacter sp. MG-6-Vaara-E2]|uniref:hypothetical protein n=1 Tax=Polynucleobacter sp. MG-6-Vaara-E2 TaxID=2576932 RepID=UPI001BFD56D2|nr:hypothetical protein [Polynucleobacter sp. MG-6-Vaara-E2]QWD96916.1 hypothetical protein ICV38_01735 [Polynucleobacter sp. MG-6-Vaara-E2]